MSQILYFFLENGSFGLRKSTVGIVNLSGVPDASGDADVDAEACADGEVTGEDMPAEVDAFVAEEPALLPLHEKSVTIIIIARRTESTFFIISSYFILVLLKELFKPTVGEPQPEHTVPP